jgi:hypothetical protein
MHKCWSLYNKEEKLRIDDLRVDQVKTILLAIPSSRIGEWYACCEGDLSWQSLADVPDFYEEAMEHKGKDPHVAVKADTAPSTTKPQVARRPLFEDAADAADTTLQMESAQTKERRSARRYVRNLNFRLSGTTGLKFMCETANISMSGISLTEALPPTTPKNFRAELSLDGTNLRILCNKVSDTTVKILEADAWDVLRNWIVNW